MRVQDYCDALGLELIIRRYPNQNERWTASFEHCETKDEPDSGVLAGTYGNGMSPFEALDAYCRLLDGKILVVNAMCENRREYRVPHLEP